MTDSHFPPRKPIFDALRRMIGRGFRQSEVDAIDDALDETLGDTGYTSGRESDTLPHAKGYTSRGKSDALTNKGDTLGTNSHTLGPKGDSLAVFPLDRVPCVPSVPRIRRTTPGGDRVIGDDGIALIKRFEGCARLRRDGMVEAYPDPGTGAEPWTIGWGATGPDDSEGGAPGQRIGPGTVWTQAQCDARLERDLVRYARDVARALGDAPTTQGQFDALVSFHYNTGAIARATLTKKHVAGDHAGALAEFARWNRASGRMLKGLVRRRAAEAKLYAS